MGVTTEIRRGKPEYPIVRHTDFRRESGPPDQHEQLIAIISFMERIGINAAYLGQDANRRIGSQNPVDRYDLFAHRLGQRMRMYGASGSLDSAGYSHMPFTPGREERVPTLVASSARERMPDGLTDLATTKLPSTGSPVGDGEAIYRLLEYQKGSAGVHFDLFQDPDNGWVYILFPQESFTNSVPFRRHDIIGLVFQPDMGVEEGEASVKNHGDIAFIILPYAGPADARAPFSPQE